MSAINDYAAKMARGLKQGLSEIGSNALADIGNRYQEILMADATIKPGDILPRGDEIGDRFSQEAELEQHEEAEHAADPHHLEPYMDR
jgi:hypothetical protein